MTLIQPARRTRGKKGQGRLSVVVVVVVVRLVVVIVALAVVVIARMSLVIQSSVQPPLLNAVTVVPSLEGGD